MEESPAPAAAGKAAVRILLAVVLAAALLSRGMRCREGLPYLHEWDEPQTASNALRMMKTGDLNPRFFHYGSVMIYANLLVDCAHFLYLMARPGAAEPPISSLSEIQTRFDTRWHWTISHPSFILWNRWLTALLGTALVGLTYLVGRDLAGRWAGLAATALLAFLEPHVEHASLVTPNIPYSFLIVACALLAVRFLSGGRPGHLIASLAAGGFAASTKYNAGLALLAPLAALVQSALGRHPGYRRWLWAALPIAPPIAFVLGSPFALIDLPRFLEDAGYEVRHYEVTGHVGGTIDAGMAQVRLHGGLVLHHVGYAAAGASLVGVVAMARGAAGRTLLLVPVVIFIHMSGTRLGEHRNFLAIYPFLCAAFGCGLVAAARALDRRTGAPARLRRPGRAALIATACFSPLSALAVSGPVSWSAWTIPETRTRAILRAAAIASGGGPSVGPIGIAQELRVHEQDLRRLPVPYVVAPFEELACRGADSFGLILGAATHRGDTRATWEVAPLLDAIRPAGISALESIAPERWLHLEYASRDPGVILYAAKGALEPGGPPCATLSDGLEVPADAKVRTGRLSLAPGRHLITWRARCRSEEALRSLRATLMASPAGRAAEARFLRAFAVRDAAKDCRLVATSHQQEEIFLVLESASAPGGGAEAEDTVVLVEPIRVLRLLSPEPPG